MLIKKRMYCLLLLVFMATTLEVHGAAEEFACGSPKKPYDDDIQTVPPGAGFSSPIGTHGDDWTEADAREAAEKEIGDKHDPYECADCEGDGCQKDVQAHPQDAKWKYDWVTCVGADPDCSETHFYYTNATLQPGGFYLRTCTDC